MSQLEAFIGGLESIQVDDEDDYSLKRRTDFLRVLDELRRAM